MAIYHLHAKVHGRSRGACVVAKAAYRAGLVLHDERQGLTFDYRRKSVELSEIFLPPGTPEWMADRAKLWNAVEKAEKRKDAQLARDVEMALPVELSREQQLALVRAYAKEQFVARGMIADVAIHDPTGDNPHAHILLTMRNLTAEGFGDKNRDWNDKALLTEWRAEWANHCNLALERAGFTIRISDKSHAVQGIKLEPTKHLGVPTQAARQPRHPRSFVDKRLVVADLCDEHRRIVGRNTNLVLKRPEVALHALATTCATFTETDLVRYLTSHVDSEKIHEITARCLRHHSVISLGVDDDGKARYVLESTLKREREVLAHADRLARRSRHTVSTKDAAMASLTRRFGFEQELAYRYLTQESPDIAVLQGFAGAGKSYLLGAARQAWEAAGYRVLGATIAGKAAASLEQESGIKSRTLASRMLAWSQCREKLTSKDILVLDEAGMIGSATMRSVLALAEAAGAKVVATGDTEQIAAVDAGSPMQAIANRVGQVTISEVRRQNTPWMCEATRNMGLGNAREALQAYLDHGCFVQSTTHQEAITKALASWVALKKKDPDASIALLAYTRADVATMNRNLRDILKQESMLPARGSEFKTTNGLREFVVGDRFVFLKNDRAMNVKNGTLGSVTAIDTASASITVKLDAKAGEEPREVQVQTKHYSAVDHGYALTAHKTQGDTTQHAIFVASPHVTKNVTYVALSRHKESVELHWSTEHFNDAETLMSKMSRKSHQIEALDYAAACEIDTDLDPDQKQGPRFERAPLKARIETRNRLAEERLKRLSDSELLEQLKAIEPMAKRRMLAPSDATADYPAIAILTHKVKLAHEAFAQAASPWDKFCKEYPTLRANAERRRGPGADLHSAFIDAFKARERAMADLQSWRRRIHSQENAMNHAHREHVEIRRAQAEVRRINAVIKERQRLKLHQELSTLEPQHAECMATWLKWKSEASRTDLAHAYDGEGAGAEILERYRETEKKCSTVRYELAGLVQRRSDFFKPLDAPLPETEKELVELAKVAQTKVTTALNRWVDFVHTSTPALVELARQDPTNKHPGAALYLDYVRGDFERRAVGKRLSEKIRERRIAEMQTKLEAAEATLFAHDLQISSFQGRFPKDLNALLYQQLHLVKVSKQDRLEADLTPLLNNKSLALAVAQAGQCHQEAAEAWQLFRIQHPEAVAQARLGDGDGDDIYHRWVFAALAHRSVCEHVSKLRAEAISIELTAAEQAREKAGLELEEHLVQHPEDNGRRCGNNHAAKLYQNEKEADREVGRLQWQLDLELGLKHTRASAAAGQDITVLDRLHAAQVALRQASAQWEIFKRSATPEAIFRARCNETAAAKLLGQYRMARAERQQAIVEIARKAQERRNDAARGEHRHQVAPALLTAIKSEINLAAYVAAQGYEIDRKKTSRNSILLRKGDDSVVVSRAANGNWMYFAIGKHENGSILDFVQHRSEKALNAVVEHLQAWAKSQGQIPAEFCLTPRSAADMEFVKTAFARMQVAESTLYLDLRGIGGETLTHPRFAGRVFRDDKYNAVFPNYGADGSLAGFEVKSSNGSQYSAGGHKTAWTSNALAGDTALVITEAPIDAMSYHRLFGDDATRYISTSGAMGQAQKETIERAIRKMPANSRIVLAFDRDAAGDRFAEEIRGRIPAEYVVERPLPAHGKDWNDELVYRERGGHILAEEHASTRGDQTSSRSEATSEIAELARALTRAEATEEQAAAVWRYAVRNRADLAIHGRNNRGDLTDLARSQRQMQRVRVRLEDQLADALRVSSDSMMTTLPLIPSIAPPERCLASAETRLLRATTAWAEFRDKEPLEVVLQARAGNGPGASLLREYREARSQTQAITKLVLDDRAQRSQQQKHER